MYAAFKHHLKYAHAALIGQRCTLCEQTNADGLVCAPCQHALYQPRCPRCASAMVHPNTLCGACISHPPAFDATVCLGGFNTPLAHLVSQLKFGARLTLAPWCAQQLLFHVSNLDIDAVIAIPLHDNRLRSRGYNQSVEIAKHLPYPLLDALARIRDTPSQRNVTASQRFNNVKNAFVVTKKVQAMRLLLVDDVVTTTATIQSASLALKRAGAGHITVACVARVD